jgi:hypothetical protein
MFFPKQQNRRMLRTKGQPDQSYLEEEEEDRIMIIGKLLMIIEIINNL